MSDLGPRLPPDLLEDLFYGPILQEIYYDLEAAHTVPLDEQPQAILVVGQPGARTALAQLQFMQGDYYHVGGVAPVVEHPRGLVALGMEDLRAFHPDYETLRRDRPHELDSATEQDTLWLQNRAVEYLQVRRYNLLIERDWDSPEAVTLTAERLSAAGYGVQVAGLAVPAVLSRLALVESFTRQAESSGSGRWVSAEAHDASYATTAEVLERAERSEAVTRLTVHVRDGVAHDKRRDPKGLWPHRAPAAVDILVQAREAALTPAARAAIASRLAMALERLEAAGVAHLAQQEMGTEIVHALSSARTAMAGDLEATASAIADANASLDALDPELDIDDGFPPPSPDPPEPEI